MHLGFRPFLPILAAAAVAAVLILPCAGMPASPAQDAQADQPSEEEASRKDLLKRLDALEGKLPQELARKLIVISMKIATGWCSPHLAEEFEAEIDRLSERQRRRFEKEWKAVREHAAWPTVSARKQASQKK